MKVKRNDDIIMIDCKLYQFVRDEKFADTCSKCVFQDESQEFCNPLHCTDCSRIDKLDGHYVAI